jgi:hypothetical protein
MLMAGWVVCERRATRCARGFRRDTLTDGIMRQSAHDALTDVQGLHGCQPVGEVSGPGPVPPVMTALRLLANPLHHQSRVVRHSCRVLCFVFRVL